MTVFEASDEESSNFEEASLVITSDQKFHVRLLEKISNRQIQDEE